MPAIEDSFSGQDSANYARTSRRYPSTIKAWQYMKWPLSSATANTTNQTPPFYLAVFAKNIMFPHPTAGPANEFPGPQPFGNH